ncbi:choice-of-anchor F family protein [Maritimibacter fusiformis]|uniref:Autotransporter outer membrane beta-barrel domain-containing protein n=1 Tax=Maritimibacter fusiformis TaxID=2603819 RepID=A0A5D0RLA8_9RHOB|nr:choice-of-anchor F family protein [Maritimibacter fusiformis]TYB82302.1 autotransporter outer membrane beta-barrel domain-containing protein [Maritimibacter fusiformis]
MALPGWGTDMKSRCNLLASTALTVSVGLGVSPAIAGEITSFGGAFGDGIIYIDESENVVAPGMKPVTGSLNNDDFTSGNGFSPSGVVNCLMANNDNTCASPPGTGKRWKSWLEGPGGFDMQFLTSSTGGVTEYFNYGKLTNYSGARVAGFSFLLGTGVGADFTLVAAGGADGVSFDNLVAASTKAGEWPTVTSGDLEQNPLQRFFFPGGLFGTGGQEGIVGFFSADSAGFDVIPNADLNRLDTGVFFNADHIALFGEGLLDRSRLPEGVFWDDDGNPDTEGAVIAWYHTGAGEWRYGNLLDDPATPEDEEQDFLDSLAAALGVTVPELAHTGTQGAPVPDAIVALMESKDAFEFEGIEDISNLNLNYSLDVGDIAFGEFTVRVSPLFFPIVAAAGTDYQFGVAATLDAANIPYLGADAGYLTTIGEILALPTAAEQHQALERIGYSFLGAQRNLEYEMGTQTIGNVLFGSSLANGEAYGGAAAENLSTKNGADIPPNGAARWSLAGGLEGFASLSGFTGSVATSPNSIGYSFQGFNAVAGVSANLWPDFEAGVAISYGAADATIDDGRGSLAAQNFGGAIFGRGEFDNGLRLSGVAGYQFGDIDSTRNIAAVSINSTAFGSNSVSDLFAAASVEWMMDLGALSIGPAASGEYHHITTGGFTETGAGIYNVTMDGFTSDVFNGSLTIKGSYDIPTSNGGIELYGHAGYAVMSSGDLAVPFGFGPVLTGTTYADGASFGYFDVGAGVKANLGDFANVGVEYRGALFSNDYRRHSFRVGLEMTF